MTEIQKFTIILLKLPDGKLVLQRRTKDAPYAPGRLGIFGGWVENNESITECLAREIKEETSLDIGKLNVRLATDFIIPKGVDFPEDRHFYLFTGDIDTLNFDVYEGDGAEAIDLKEAIGRSDLTGSARYTFLYVLPKLFGILN